MKAITVFCVIILTLATLSCNQHNNKMSSSSKKVTVANFIKGEDYRLIDTLKAAHLQSYLSQERELSADSIMILEKQLEEIAKNGTDDITKCFIPRHSINFYRNDTIENFALICFECEGIRFSENSQLTSVKDVEKRMEQIKELKKYFGIK